MDTLVAQRYEFLEELHQLLKPRGYLEIGVQHGGSMQLSQCDSLGIDPAPLVIDGTLRGDQRVIVATSDHYFESINKMMPTYVDLAFIDGMHLSEFAVRDFMNVEKRANEHTVIVFDDVLPYNAQIATRIQPQGDWTGDVWRIIEVLRTYRQDLRMLLVDTFPTGSLVVFGVDPTNRRLDEWYSTIHHILTTHEPAPLEWVLDRRDAISRADAIETLRQWKETW